MNIRTGFAILTLNFVSGDGDLKLLTLPLTVAPTVLVLEAIWKMHRPQCITRTDRLLAIFYNPSIGVGAITLPP